MTLYKGTYQETRPLRRNHGSKRSGSAEVLNITDVITDGVVVEAIASIPRPPNAPEGLRRGEWVQWEASSLLGHGAYPRNMRRVDVGEVPVLEAIARAAEMGEQPTGYGALDMFKKGYNPATMTAPMEPAPVEVCNDVLSMFRFMKARS